MENENNCQDCRKLTIGQKWMIGVSFFMLSTSIYGTIILIKNIINYF